MPPDLTTTPAAASIAALRRAAATRLAAAGIDDPEREALLVLRAALAGGREAMILDPRLALAPEPRRRFEEILARRLAREPLSRIIGERDFYGRGFHISAVTLDPRPETETLIEQALDIVGEEGWRDRPIRILDVGTGSGCLLVTLLAELPAASGLATDMTLDALDVARANAVRHGVADRADFRRVRSLEGIAETFDVLVSNPPYVASADIAGLAPEVRDFDPRIALDGGGDGLDVYREIARDLFRIVPSGWAVLEAGAGQAEDIARLFAAPLWVQSSNPKIRFRSDLAGHTRCVSLRTHH